MPLAPGKDSGNRNHPWILFRRCVQACWPPVSWQWLGVQMDFWMLTITAFQRAAAREMNPKLVNPLPKNHFLGLAHAPRP